MKRLQIDKTVYNLPSSWNEMTTTQLIALSRIVAKNTTINDIQLKFLLHCVSGRIDKDLSNGTYLMKTEKSKHVLFADELMAILTVFDWMFVETDNGFELHSRLTKNHFKNIQCGCKFVYGPQDFFEDITYNQFVWLLTWQSQLSSNPNAIDEMMNVVYKTQSGKQDVENIRKASETTKVIFIWFWQGTLNFLEQKFPHVFSGGGETEAQTNIFEEHQKIIDTLAEGDVTKKEEVRSSLLYDALFTMEMAAIKIEEATKKQLQ